MAGKRQHYVPRLLQRGFLHDHAEGAERTWLHRRGVNARLVGIRDVGVEDWFYSRKSLDGQLTLDDLITNVEGDLSAAVNGLRGTPPGEVVDPHVAARCVVHLVMRTDHLRRMMSEGATSLTNELQSLFTIPSRLADLFGLDAPELSQSLMESIREAALELAPAGVPSALAERLMSALTRENGDGLVRKATNAMGPLFPLLLGTLISKVRDAHNRALEAPPEGNGWVDRLATFRWFVEAGEDLILPDAVALAAEADGRLVPLMFTGVSDATAVAMPVSSSLILVGIQPGRGAFDLTRFNRQAAAACSAFFIGARSFSDSNLAELIGTGPALSIQAAIDDAVSSVEQGRAAPPSASAQPQERAGEQEAFSYSIQLADYGDAAHAKKIGEVIEAVVREVARHHPLHNLEGFTIAADYPRALAAPDRGNPSLPPAASNALEYGIGVAMPVTVGRHGQRKQHVVISAGIAGGWFSDDAETQAGALNILVKMLASVAHSTRFDRDAAVTFKLDPRLQHSIPPLALPRLLGSAPAVVHSSRRTLVPRTPTW